VGTMGVSQALDTLVGTELESFDRISAEEMDNLPPLEPVFTLFDVCFFHFIFLFCGMF